MSRLPFMQFYPADWLQDTRALSPWARGIWIDLICALWVAPERGKLVWTFDAMENFTGYSEMEFAGVLSELQDTGTANVEIDNVKRCVTVMSRRIMREESIRKQTLERVKRFRNAPVTQMKRRIYHTSEVRSHKSEEEKKPQAACILPDWLPKKEWEEFAASRKRKRAPLTDSISARIIAVVDRLRGAGHKPADVLTQAVDRNWTSIEFDWIHKPGPSLARNGAEQKPMPRVQPAALLGERIDEVKLAEGRATIQAEIEKLTKKFSIE